MKVEQEGGMRYLVQDMAALGSIVAFVGFVAVGVGFM